MSRHLRIQVHESGELRVDLFMPAPCAGRLNELIPPHWVPVAQSASLDLEQISKDVARDQFEARELFCLNAGPKSVRAWLE